jgi:hypothetical protein
MVISFRRKECLGTVDDIVPSVGLAAGTACRSTRARSGVLRQALWLTVALASACSYDAGRLQAPTARGRDGPVDHASAFETSAVGGDNGDVADLGGAGGSTGPGADGAGGRDALVAIDESDAPLAADGASMPDGPAVLDGADAADLPVPTEPDAPIDQAGGAEAGGAETGGAGGAGGAGGTGGAGTGGTSSQGGAGGTVATGGAATGGTGGLGGAGGATTWDGSAAGSGGADGSAGTGGSGGTPVTHYRLAPQSLTTSSLEVIGGATTNGTQVQMATTAPVDKQAFALLDAGGGNLMIAMKANHAKCLGPVGNSTANYTLLEVQDCNGTSNQAFTQVSNSGKPGFWFKNVRAGRCIDVKGGGLTNGALVQILDCNTYATSYNQYLQPQAL